MLARLEAGEPLQYVLGRWGFRRLDLMVDRRVLIPRPETELVVEVALGLAEDMPSPITCVDLGTGSGAIGLSLAAELPLDHACVWMTDRSAEALDVAAANATGIGRAAAHVRVAHGWWFEALPDELRGHIDLIVANPPYVAAGDPQLEPSVRDWEPQMALLGGPDGLDDITAIAAQAPSWLRPGGWIVMEIGADQGDAVRAVLRDAGFTDVEIRSDLSGRDRIAVARRASSTEARRDLSQE
jgi:release factor glutamine methyltransferase